MKIDTPLLHPFQGDSTSRPIFAETATYDGFNKVFTINKVFKDEEINRTHLMEFT